MKQALPFAILCCLAAPLAPAQQRDSHGPRDRSDFTLLRDEGFPLNLDPEAVPASQAPLDDGDMVIGLVLNQEARAYPVNYMNGPTNEVVNDTLGNTPIAPSW
jgi:hypothetical protein